MAQVTYNEEEQTFEVQEESVNDPIAEGMEGYLQQIEETLLENEVQEDAIPEQDTEVQPDETDLPLDADMDQEGVEAALPDTVEIPQDIPPYYLPSYLDAYGDSGLESYALVPSNAAFSPQSWQINLAEGRQLGEHYLMYGIRRSSGSGYYWEYYLVLGRDITYENDVYTYSDCDVYSYYNYSSTVYYELSVDSGSVNGNSSLVYSDLYFDYVGIDPVVNSYPFISFALFIVLFALILIGGRKRV